MNGYETNKTLNIMPQRGGIYYISEEDRILLKSCEIKGNITFDMLIKTLTDILNN